MTQSIWLSVSSRLSRLAEITSTASWACASGMGSSHGDAAVAPQHEGPPALRLGRELQVGEGLEQGRQRLAELHAGQRGAEAEVHADAEGQVGVGVAVDPELVGRLEDGRVAVGRTEQGRDLLALLDDDLADLHVL